MKQFPAVRKHLKGVPAIASTTRVVAAGTGLVLLMLLGGCAQRAGHGADAAGSDSPRETAGARNGLASASDVQPDLVRLGDVAPAIRQDMRYAGHQNILGRPAAGYETPQCWLSRPAALSLKSAQDELASRGLRLKVFDCYRPQSATDDFLRWSRDLKDQKTRKAFYPNVPKQALVPRGYIQSPSAHGSASTVDLTLIVVDGHRAVKVLRGPLADGGDVDMGTPFDFLDPLSSVASTELAPDVQHNRRWLQSFMLRHGWRGTSQVWWHFTLANEPYAGRHFDQPVR